MSTAGLYIHVPFCEGKCPYCDFYSLRGNAALYDAYTAAVLRAIEHSPYDFSAKTIYFGGGTPTLLGAERLCAILSAAKAKFGSQQLETTLEANPCSVDEAMLIRLRKGGFDRISFGVQSLDDTTLKLLGRKHSENQAISAIELAAKAGFRHISADLMLAVPNQTVSEIARSIETLSTLPIDHISAYMLKIEPKAAFFGRFTEPDEELYADCYQTAINACKAHGFLQYVISNFAKSDDAQSRHNLIYWRCENYLGIGPAAHSFMNGERFYFERDINAFINAENCWSLAVSDGSGGDEEERLMLGLRLSEGVLLSSFSAPFAEQVKKRAQPLIKANLIDEKDNRLFITENGFLVSNSIIASLI